MSIEQQAIQAAHAAIEYALEHTQSVTQHPSYIHLSALDKNHLLNIKMFLNQHGVSYCEFYEPYDNWGLTALSCFLSAEEKHLLAHLPLWSASEKKQKNHQRYLSELVEKKPLQLSQSIALESAY